MPDFSLIYGTHRTPQFSQPSGDRHGCSRSRSPSLPGPTVGQDRIHLYPPDLSLVHPAHHGLGPAPLAGRGRARWRRRAGREEVILIVESWREHGGVRRDLGGDSGRGGEGRRGGALWWWWTGAPVKRSIIPGESSLCYCLLLLLVILL